MAQLRNTDLGGCENCGPFLGSLVKYVYLRNQKAQYGSSKEPESPKWCNSGAREPTMAQLRNTDLGGCENYGPFLGP